MYVKEGQTSCASTQTSDGARFALVPKPGRARGSWRRFPLRTTGGT